MIRKRTTAPDNSRTPAKPDASISLIPNANRHNIEFAANAISATSVKRIVFTMLTVNLWLNFVSKKIEKKTDFILICKE